MSERLVIGNTDLIAERDAAREAERYDEFLDEMGINPKFIDCDQDCGGLCRRPEKQPEVRGLFNEGILWCCVIASEEPKICECCGQETDECEDENVSFFTDHHGQPIPYVNHLTPLSYDAQVEIMRVTMVVGA